MIENWQVFRTSENYASKTFQLVKVSKLESQIQNVHRLKAHILEKFELGNFDLHENDFEVVVTGELILRWTSKS